MMMLIIIDTCLYSIERKKGYRFGWVGCWEILGGVGGGKAVIRIYCMKTVYFQQSNQKRTQVWFLRFDT